METDTHIPYSKKLSQVQPYGNLNTANILVIGHDPRLQKSQAEAEKAFFFEYLEKYSSRPTYGPDARKYAFAHAVWEYMADLAGCALSLNQLFVTNLCNEFLPSSRGGGTVLIPDERAEHGVREICQIVSKGHFRIILPMSVQVFYHLCRLNFLDEEDKSIQIFIKKASPAPKKSIQGIYTPSGKTPFLDVCGRLYHHLGIPLVPIVYVKQWPLKARTTRYTDPMESAKHEVRTALQ